MNELTQLGIVITPTITQALTADQILRPTSVQTEGIPAVLSGANTLLHAGTGTGKTLAYLLPLLQLLRDQPERRAVILAPGAELAMQTHRIAQRYKDAGISAAAAISTTNQKRQRKRLTKSTRLITGTPDRVLALLKGGKLKGVTLVVLDELDPLLRSANGDMLGSWLSRSEPKVQLVIASATLGRTAQAFVDQFLVDGVRIRPADDPLTAVIQHQVVRIGPGRAKDLALARFIERHHCHRAIVFVADARQQAHLVRFLRMQGHEVQGVGREGTKQQRQKGLRAFRSAERALLVTTDAIARGLDMPAVDWVLHHDLPRSPTAYVHRAGRTARAGRSGTSVVFVEVAVLGNLRRLAKQLQITFKATS